MSQTYNVYCDESCHLEHDKQKIMALGALWCDKEKTREAFERIREIKEKYNLNKNFEIKWSKVSPAKINFYLEIVDYFFDDDDLHFRCLVVPSKSTLNHNSYKQTHDDFYYKMYFDLLKTIFSPEDKYKIYIDIKDTKGGEKVKKLHKVICNNMYDFNRKIVENMQIVKSDEVELMQINDFLLGSVAYINRGLNASEAKNKLIKRVQERSGYSLTKSTLYRENKINIFIWKSK